MKRRLIQSVLILTAVAVFAVLAWASTANTKSLLRFRTCRLVRWRVRPESNSGNRGRQVRVAKFLVGALLQVARTSTSMLRHMRASFPDTGPFVSTSEAGSSTSTNTNRPSGGVSMSRIARLAFQCFLVDGSPTGLSGSSNHHDENLCADHQTGARVWHIRSATQNLLESWQKIRAHCRVPRSSEPNPWFDHHQ